MALELRPNCEYCDRDLPPESVLARICSYECTFCTDCVDHKLSNVCPNCGGGFAARPIRPAREWRPGLSLATRPASASRVYLSYSEADIAAHSERIRDIEPKVDNRLLKGSRERRQSGRKRPRRRDAAVSCKRNRRFRGSTQYRQDRGCPDI